MNNPYILYIGSAYPHKNIPILFAALKMIPNLNLLVISSRSVFLDRLKIEAKQNQVADQVKFVGFKTDKEVTDLYQFAVALVHPSQSEGFGLTGLEAMQAGCPVISSSATCLPEIYGPGALYFEPDDLNMLIAHINTLIAKPEIRNKQIKLGKIQAAKYSWDKMVDETLEVYKDIIRHSGKDIASKR